MKPAAWQERQRTGDTWTGWYDCMDRRLDAPRQEVRGATVYEWRPVYAAPEPLTDEQIAAVLHEASKRAGFVTLEPAQPSVYMIDIVRLIERAHGIGVKE